MNLQNGLKKIPKPVLATTGLGIAGLGLYKHHTGDNNLGKILGKSLADHSQSSHTSSTEDLFNN